MGIGGGATFTLGLSKVLRGKGHWVAMSAAGGELSEETRRNSDLYNSMPLWHSLQRPLLKRFLRKHGIECVNAHAFTQAAVALPVCKSLGIPFVITLHGPHGRKRLEQWKPLLSQADAVMVMNEQVARFYWLAGVPKEKLFLTRLFLPWPGTPPERGGVETIGICARLSGLKGPISLAFVRGADASEMARQKRIVLVGDGPYRRQVELEGKNLGLDLEAWGSVPNASSRFGEIDVLAGGGYVALEGLRAGCAVVGMGFDGCMGAVSSGNLNLALGVNFGDHALRRLSQEPEFVAGEIEKAFALIQDGRALEASNMAKAHCCEEAVAGQLSSFFSSVQPGGYDRNLSLPFQPEVDLGEAFSQKNGPGR